MPKQKPPTSRPRQFCWGRICWTGRGREGDRESDFGEESGKCLQFKRLNQLHCTNNSVRKLRKSEVKTPQPPPTPHPLYACHHLRHLQRTLKNLLFSSAVKKRTWALGNCHNELSFIIFSNIIRVFKWGYLWNYCYTIKLYVMNS